ncbi:hypothetical protein Vadar_033652 [Vaccinium darrowii]|uniref:Uncharacterized protein n=1 Tax=Vaccinium darrowii TaxID=229202 RepID=A0ACB7Z1A4_9ERIC|nr:hypothetical protein Vadar_033652 [Vaccinium darrowii]
MAPIDVDDDDLHVRSNDVTIEPQQKKREDKVYARRLIHALSKRKVVWSSEDIDNDKHQKSKQEKMVEADVSPDDFDYDSDYSDYGGRFRSMTRAESERYDKQLLESGGFDVDVPHEVVEIGLIRPLNFDKDPQFFEELKNCSRYAIEHYNFNNTTNYRFMRPVKVCSQMVAGMNHYITFEAKATAAAAPMYFQALVYHRVWEDYIKTTNYQFTRPVKVCSQLVAGKNHYITFDAKATAAAALVYFQALVYHRVWEDYIEVTFCRRKPES